MDIQFDGQQTDERILYVVTPHQFAKYVALVKLIFLAVFFFLILQLIGSVVKEVAAPVRLASVVLTAILLIVGGWWNQTVYGKSKTYITDRRIIRFEVMTPFFTTKRALFWNEALKAKGYAPNIFWKMLKIGKVRVEPQLAEGEDVLIHDVYMYDDVANYIDKILFTFKNKPAEVAAIVPFVPKPKGQRD
ncbi:hypothetical protein HY086_06000 [Candidatus Gottesmanbacteria bacterium]|nr:hypothetical protein [Candidatus Gottesmanbacteria bacterium]